MCGIAGLIAKDSPTLGNDLINMLKELIHRGKDATGVAINELPLNPKTLFRHFLSLVALICLQTPLKLTHQALRKKCVLIPTSALRGEALNNSVG